MCDFWKNLLLNGKCSLSMFPQEYIVECKKELIERFDLALSVIPKDEITQSDCELAVSNFWIAFKFVPDHFKTRKLYMKYFEKFPKAISLIPDEFITTEMCQRAAINKVELTSIPKRFWTFDMIKLFVMFNGINISFLSPAEITPELAELAISSNGLALEFITSFDYNFNLKAVI